MKIDRYVTTASIFILLTSGAYIWNFYIELGYKVSEEPEHWALLGDFFGGILNPILSFISIILLIKSLTLQNLANRSLRRELQATEKTEKYRQFESLFFNLVDSQRELFKSFRIEVVAPLNKVAPTYKETAKAVIFLEDAISSLRENGSKDADIERFLEEIDENDSIFGIIRAFYITVKLIDEKLSDLNDFSSPDRQSHYTTLINLTDFSQLRLILIGIQFLNYQSSQYIKNNSDFMNTLEGLGFENDQY